MLLIFLQNAYRPTGRYNDRDEWLGRMWKSHTGRRLKAMLPEGIDVYVENASPEIGRKPNAVFPPDVEHIRQVVEQVEPSVILACGRLAQSGLDKLGVEYVPAPHPAYRALSHEMTAEIRRTLEGIVS